MKKYRVKGVVHIKANAEILMLARSMGEAWNLCEDHPEDFLNLSTLDAKACEVIEFDVDEIIKIAGRA